MNDILKEMEPLFEVPAKMKLQQEAMEALEWIESTLENIKGDTFFEANKNDCLSVIAKAIKKLV